MNAQILVALITVAGTIAIAALTFYLNERAKRNAEWQQKKFGFYKNIMSALSDLAVDGADKEQANEEFNLAYNTSALFASQEVVTALMRFQEHIKASNQNRSIEKHDQLLTQLVLAIRKDIGLSERDDPNTFEFHLIGSRPKK